MKKLSEMFTNTSMLKEHEVCGNVHGLLKEGEIIYQYFPRNELKIERKTDIDIFASHTNSNATLEILVGTDVVGVVQFIKDYPGAKIEYNEQEFKVTTQSGLKIRVKQADDDFSGFAFTLNAFVYLPFYG